jgi:hypothetical protein
MTDQHALPRDEENALIMLAAATRQADTAIRAVVLASMDKPGGPYRRKMAYRKRQMRRKIERLREALDATES